MKKLIVGSLCAAMLAAPTASAFASENADSFREEYGYTVISPEMTMSEEFEILTNGEAASISANISMDDGREHVAVDLPQYVLATPDGLYINVESLLGAFKEIPGMENAQGVLTLLGVTDEWVNIVPIDLSALHFNVIPYTGALPELSEQAVTDLTAALTSLVRVEATEEGVGYVIDNDTILASAAALDEFKNNDLQFVGDMLTYLQDIIAGNADIDIKPAIRDYLDAAAEGIALANSEISEEEAKATIDNMVDTFVAQGLSEATMSLKEVSLADMWNNASIKEAVEQALANTSIELKFVSDESNDATIVITVNGEKVTGIFKEVDDTQIQGSFYDNADNLLGIIAVTAEGPEHINVVIKDASENMLCNVDISADISYVPMKNAFTFDMVAPLSNSEIHWYYTKEEWTDDGSLATPESASDILTIIKNAVMMAFMSMGN